MQKSYTKVCVQKPDLSSQYAKTYTADTYICVKYIYDLQGNEILQAVIQGYSENNSYIGRFLKSKPAFIINMDEFER